MTERKVTKAEDKPVEIPEITKVGIAKKTVVSTHDDVFADPAEEFKSFSGASSNTKRRITNEVKKFASNDFEKKLEGTGGAKSKQVVDKEFLSGYDVFNVIEPPYNLDYLSRLYELSSAHMSAVNAKVSNIVGLGFKFVENSKSKRNFERIAEDEEKTKKMRRKLDESRDNLLEQIDKLNQEDEFLETLIKVWRDYETTGNGYIEIGRKNNDEIGYVGHISSKTMRIRRDRDGFVQASGFEVQFFAHFGAAFDDEGERVRIPNPIGDDEPNEVIHIKKYSPSNSYYGVPDIVSALSAIVGNDFASKFNLDYFENKAVPRHLIILKGATLGSQAENALLSFFETGLKGQNHRSLYIPLPPDSPDNKVEFNIEAIESGVQDASFTNYRRANLSDILMAHRVPITKISVSEGASLSIAKDADKTFKEQVCRPEQSVFQKKLNRVFKEMTPDFDFSLNEMTLTDENTQSQIDERRRKTGVETANEQRLPRGLPAIEGGDEVFDMNAATKLAEMADKTTRRGQDKSVEAKANAATGTAGANANGNPAGTRQRDTQRSANATDSADGGRNPKGEGRTTA